MEIQIAVFDAKVICLENVFLHFPHLKESALPASGVLNKYYSAQFALDKKTHKELIDTLIDECKKLVNEYCSRYSYAPDDWTLRIPSLFDGSSLTEDRFEPFMFLKCTSKKKPEVYDNKGELLDNEEVYFVKGAVVDAEISLRGSPDRKIKTYKVISVLKAVWLPYY